jgi:hypothetical protein
MKNLISFSALLLLAGMVYCQSTSKSAIDPHQEVERTFEQYVNAMKTVNVDSLVAFWTDDLKLITSDSDGKCNILFSINQYEKSEK